MHILSNHCCPTNSVEAASLLIQTTELDKEEAAIQVKTPVTSSPLGWMLSNLSLSLFSTHTMLFSTLVLHDRRYLSTRAELAGCGVKVLSQEIRTEISTCVLRVA